LPACRAAGGILVAGRMLGCQGRTYWRSAVRAQVLPGREKPPGRTLMWNQCHLLGALREFEDLHNTHRTLRRDRLGGILHEYDRAA
jgi:hypothetical protein